MLPGTDATPGSGFNKVVISALFCARKDGWVGAGVGKLGCGEVEVWGSCVQMLNTSLDVHLFPY